MIDLQYIIQILCCNKDSNNEIASKNIFYWDLEKTYSNYEIPSTNKNYYELAISSNEENMTKLYDVNYYKAINNYNNIFIKSICYPSFNRYDTYIYTQNNNDFIFYHYSKNNNEYLPYNLLLEYKLSNIYSFYDLNFYFKLCYHNTKNKIFKSAYKLKLKEIINKKVNLH
uniref:Uncharacterized protein n=1 Tax=viral metagenome TaxID=1070528 RepID=A0A6C0D8V5_9ZZZZ